MKLQGRTAIVTGADSGIGQAIATLFAQEGADVCIGFHTDHDGAAETQRRVEAAGRRAVTFQVTWAIPPPFAPCLPGPRNSAPWTS